MAKQVISESLKQKALEYRKLTIEKYEHTIKELETRIEILRDVADSEQIINEIKVCQKMLAQFKADLENVKVISEKMFVDVVLDRELLLNVLNAFDKNKQKQTEKASPEKGSGNQGSLERKQRKSALSKMSVEELLDEVMSNERFEIEFLKLKVAENQRMLTDMFGVEPSSK